MKIPKLLDKRGNLLKNKKGQGLIMGLVMGIAALVIAVIIAFVIVSTLNDADLIKKGSTYQNMTYNSTQNLIKNFSFGIGKVSAKIPTVLLIAAVVLILGVLVLLWTQYKRMDIGGRGGGEL